MFPLLLTFFETIDAEAFEIISRQNFFNEIKSSLLKLENERSKKRISYNLF